MEWALLVLVTAALAVNAGLLWHDRRTLASLAALGRLGLHDDVLAHRLPVAHWRREGRSVQAASALLTGRYAAALALLGPTPHRVPGLADDRAAELVRASALAGLGRYAEAAALLGDDPGRPALRRVRAQVAVEVGDDPLAERLLAESGRDLLDEAGRHRLLGDLRLRRGRVADAQALLRGAQAIYSSLDDPGVDVDAAVCGVLLARAALAEHRVTEALETARSAVAALERRPDNAAGLAEAHGTAAEAFASAGDARACAAHLARARAEAARCASPAHDAQVAGAAGRAALALGQPGAAELLADAARRHDALGAFPEAERLRLLGDGAPGRSGAV
jgi:hypothetical protein